MNDTRSMQISQSELYQIPNSWMWTQIKDVSESIHYGYTASATSEKIGPKLLRITDIQNHNVNWNSVPYCRIDDINKKKYQLREGDILFARTGATVGKSYLILGKIPDSVFASYLIRIKIVKDIETKFISLFFNSPLYWSQISKGKIGIGQPNVNSQVLGQIWLPLAPYQEQKRIILKIEELFTKLDAGIEALKKAKEQLKQYHQSILKYAFEGKLTEEWRRQNKNRLKIRQTSQEVKSELSADSLKFSKDLPASWIWSRIGDIFEVIMGQSPDGKTYNKDAKGLPLLNGPTEFGPVFPSPAQWTTTPTRLSNKGDLLICVRGNTTGRMNWSDQQYCIGRGLAAIRNSSSDSNLKFLFYFLRMKVNDIMRQTTGSTFPNLKRDELEAFLIPLPSYPEQQMIVANIDNVLSVADKTQGAIKENLNMAMNLRISILKKAFEGKLIPQDPNDEPANMLLQKIQAEKSNLQSSSNRKFKQKAKAEAIKQTRLI